MDCSGLVGLGFGFLGTFAPVSMRFRVKQSSDMLGAYCAIGGQNQIVSRQKNMTLTRRLGKNWTSFENQRATRILNRIS